MNLMKLNLNVPAITETKKWSEFDVLSMCVANEFYTCGDTVAYNHMLDYVSEHETPSIDDVYRVALDIVIHSDLTKYGYSEDDPELIKIVMFELNEHAIYTSYEF